MPRRGADLQDSRNLLKGKVLMIDIDTTELAAEAATEPVEDRHTRQRRERHVALMAGLEELTDLLADAGPGSDMAGDWGRVTVHVGIYDGTIEERIARLITVGHALDAEIIEREHHDTVHFRADREFSEELEYTCAIIATGDEIAVARAALAADAATERITVDYRVDHGASRYTVIAALAQFGVDAILESPAGLSDDAANRADVIVTETGDKIKVERYIEHYLLPAPADCVSVDAYAEALAMWVKGTPEFEIPCPARPVHAARAIRSDGSVLTAYSCGHCSDDAAKLTDQGYTVVWLNPGQVPTGPEIACGLHAEMAGAR
jgi:hypothetical protein